MNNILNILLVSFCVLGLCAIIASIVFMLFSPKTKSLTYAQKMPRTSSETYENLFFQLNNAISPEEQGAAFVKMVERGDIPLHILRNKGNCYNDTLQPKIYKEFLSEQSIKALFELGG